MSPFPILAEQVVATVGEILRHQRSLELVEVLTASTARIEETGYDGWNEGTTYHTLFLDVPIPLFSRLEPDLARVESAIAEKIKSSIKNTGNDLLTNVVLAPVLVDPMSTVVRPAAESEAERIWEPGTFRLFLSHVSAHKVTVGNLRGQLRPLGVSAFVAHEDIEPTLEWQAEIDLALRSMHGMAALLTADFHKSNWTDQEIGAAVARGVLIIPVKLGIDPYGLIAKNQGLPGDLTKPGDLASSLVGILAKKPSTGPQMREALVVAIETATSWATARVVTSVLETSVGFTPDQLRRIEASIETNPEVRDSFYVPDRLRRYVASQSLS